MWRRTLALTGWLTIAACGPGEGHGEIMVVVTTDLAIPTDLDWLQWTVTLADDARTYRTGNYDLAAEGLPATLALVSGPRTKGPVRVEIVARRGGVRGAIRVVRSARVEVPDDGVRELVVHLSFLCAADDRYAQCSEDETCEAGECIPELVENGRALPAYEARDPEDCFDALACVGSRSTNLRLDGDDANLPDGGCVFSGTNASPAPNANVALVVDTGLVGNFGACSADPDGKCLVPVAHGGPGGWSDAGGSSEVIELPRGVCEALRNDVATLTVASETDECPRLTPGTPLCAAPKVCIRSAAACLDSFGPEWTGYSCSSGDAERDYPELDGCYRPDLDPERRPNADYLYCCPATEPSNGISRDPLLIDDMSAGPQLKLAAPEGHAPGLWWTSVSEEPNSAIYPVPLTMFRYRDVEPFHTEDGERIRRAACLSSATGFQGLLAMEGFHLLVNEQKRSAPAPFDASAYDGIRFYAMAPPLVPELKGAGPDLYVQFPNSQTSPVVVACNGQDCDDFRARRPLTDVWTEYTIRFDELAQEFETGATFEPTLYSIVFAVKGREQERRSQPFDFCVSQIYFTEPASE
jgi:hypothetical protein